MMVVPREALHKGNHPVITHLSPTYHPLITPFGVDERRELKGEK